MRVPNQAPPPAAPGSGDLPEAQAGFLKALAEEAAHEQRQSTAKAAKTDAEAELAPLSEAPAGEPGYAVTQPPRRRLCRRLEAWRRTRTLSSRRSPKRPRASSAGRPQQGPRRAPDPSQPPSPEALLRGQSSAAKELRIKTAADKSGYAVAGTHRAGASAAGHRSAAGLRCGNWSAWRSALLLLVGIIIAIIVGLSSSRKPQASERPVPPIQSVPTPAGDAAGVADGAEGSRPGPRRQRARRGGSGRSRCGRNRAADAGPHPDRRRDAGCDEPAHPRQERRRCRHSGDAVGDPVGGLRERGRQAAREGPDAGGGRGSPPAGMPGEPRSRLKVFISTAPAWAGFRFQRAAGLRRRRFRFTPRPVGREADRRRRLPAPGPRAGRSAGRRLCRRRR